MKHCIFSLFIILYLLCIVYQASGQSYRTWKPISCPTTDTLVDSLYFGKFSDWNSIFSNSDGVKDRYFRIGSSHDGLDTRYFRNQDTFYLFVQKNGKYPPYPTYVLCKDTISLLNIYSMEQLQSKVKQKHHHMEMIHVSNMVYIFNLRKYCDITFRIQLGNNYQEVTINPYKVSDKLPSIVSINKNK